MPHRAPTLAGGPNGAANAAAGASGVVSNGAPAPSSTSKRPRESTPGVLNIPPPSAHAPQVAAPRRIESVIFSGYEIQAAFSSPYPFDDSISATTTTGGAADGEKKALAREGGGRFAAKVEVKEEDGGLGAKGRRKSGTAGKRRQEEVERSSPVRLGTAEATVKEEESYAMDLDVEASSPFTPMEQDTEELESLGPFDDSDASSPLVVEAALVAPERPPLKQHPLATSYDATSALSVLPPPSDPLSSASPLPSPPLLPDSPLASTSTPHLVPQSSLHSSGPFVEIPVRGNGGRFLSKPEGESVKSRRRLAKAAALANPVPSAPQPMTVRAMRERDRKLREEREKEKEKEGVGQAHMTTKRLFLCEGCFKYMVQPVAHGLHQKKCIVENKSPPGRKVYQRGAHTIWEIDGATAKLYCQNLCLFAKLFIEHKYMFFDVEGFMFYVLTDARPSFDYVLGYFSKEKISYDDYNLACIVIFPPYQKKGYGTLLIEFSYELSRRTSTSPGTPERPLSDLGLKGYLAYWTGVLVRYFRAVFELRGEPPSIDLPTTTTDETEAEGEARPKRNRRSRGWDGELAASSTASTGSTTFTLRRNSHGQASAALVPRTKRQEAKALTGDHFSFPTSLADIADATNLRPDDVAFAMVESGLAQWRRKVRGEEDEDDELEELVITLELVEEVATRAKVRKGAYLEMAHVLL